MILDGRSNLIKELPDFMRFLFVPDGTDASQSDQPADCVDNLVVLRVFVEIAS
jgi:hypothetical protein